MLVARLLKKVAPLFLAVAAIAAVRTGAAKPAPKGVTKVAPAIVPTVVNGALTAARVPASSAQGGVTQNAQGGVQPAPALSDEILTHSAVPIPSSVVGDSCESGESGKLCLAVKYVVYKDASGKPVVSEADAIRVIRKVNQVWAACKLGFEIENFSAVDPTEEKLNFRISDYPELDDIRNAFGNSDELLIVTTGPWNRKGGLGNTSANAWTSVPDGPPYGSIVESPVGTFSNLFAHELGHYLDLLHVADSADLLNPVIYASSTKLSPKQCAVARSTAASHWQNALR